MKTINAKTQRGKGAIQPFQTHAPVKFKWAGGYGSGTICPKDLADKLFGEAISGPWLTCYLLRRFGWPNEGSDDYKNLMTWCLVTPIKGLYLSVTPYLGGSNLHFGIRYTRAIGRKIDADTGRDSYFRRQRREYLRWWNTVGKKKYICGNTVRSDIGAGEKQETLVYEQEEKDGKVYGIYLRKPWHDFQNKFNQVSWVFSDFRDEVLKEKRPQMTKWERATRGTVFRKQAELAIQRTLLDLLRGTNVRDIGFNCFGDMEKTYATKPKAVVEPAAGYWGGAGNGPDYWFSKDAVKERKAWEQSLGKPLKARVE